MCNLIVEVPRKSIMSPNLHNYSFLRLDTHSREQIERQISAFKGVPNINC